MAEELTFFDYLKLGFIAFLAYLQAKLYSFLGVTTCSMSH